MKLKNSKSPENILLAALLRTTEKGKVSDLLKPDTDWKYLIQTAEEHRVVPLLFQRIKNDFIDAVPLEVVNELQMRQMEIAKLNFGRTAQLIKLVDFLRKNDVAVVAYKGSALAAFAYGDITLRQFTDIDVLIRKKDFQKVKQLLADIDCQPVWKLSDKQEKAVLKYYYEYPFFYGATETLLEVHWKFVEPFFVFDFNTDELFDRIASVNLCGKAVPTISAEDSLIILCSHGSKHFWKRLNWICDIAWLLKRKDINWETVIQRASKIGSLRMIWLGLYLANDVLGVEIPEDISLKIHADSGVKTIANYLTNILFDENREIFGTVEMARIHLKMRERNRDKLKYSYRLFMTKAIDSLFMPMGRPQ